jgi:hypothetical protein
MTMKRALMSFVVALMLGVGLSSAILAPTPALADPPGGGDGGK